ncbi:hypothetical protein ACFWZR_06140 [Streptomyces sp. NPDC059017]|uniref:hypothetical protein n=1 Tax=unclassified Streptomyces TaxID=2593676 RepID=UPI0036B015F2
MSSLILDARSLILDALSLILDARSLSLARSLRQARPASPAPSPTATATEGADRG